MASVHSLTPSSGHPLISPSHHAHHAQRIGLVAGWGRYPLVIAQSLKKQGYDVYCLGGAGHADPELARHCADFQWIGLGKLGRAIRYFRRHGVTRATMAGKTVVYVIEARQVSQGDSVSGLRLAEAHARLAGHESLLSPFHSVSPGPQRRYAAGHADRRVCPRWNTVRAADQLLTGAAGEVRTTHTARADAGPAQGHRRRPQHRAA